MLVTSNLTDEIADLLIERVTVDGREFWRDIERNRLLPVVRGGDGSDDTDDDDGSDDADGDDDKGKDKTFTQAQVDRIAGRARKEAERTTRKTIDDYLATQKSETDKATMDEAARAKTEADEARADADRAKTEAAQERLAAKIERKLSRAGVDDKALERAARLITLDPDASAEDIDAEIEALREDMPGLFAATDDEDDGDDTAKANGKKKATSGVTTGSGAGKNGKGAGSKTAMERGADMWAARKAKTTTTTAA